MPVLFKNDNDEILVNMTSFFENLSEPTLKKTISQMSFNLPENRRLGEYLINKFKIKNIHALIVIIDDVEWNFENFVSTKCGINFSDENI